MRHLSRFAGLAAGLVCIALVSATSADARPCLTKIEAVKTAKADDVVHYRKVHGTQCWYVGEGADKSEFEPPRRARTVQPDIEDAERALCDGVLCFNSFKHRWPK